MFTWTLAGSTKIFQTAMMGANGVATTAAQVSNAYRTAFTGASKPFVAANMYVGYTLANTISTINVGGVVTQVIDETPVVGTQAGSNGTPINTSLLIKKSTGLIGRRYQGRLMIPQLCIAENTIAQTGIIDPAQVIAQQALWTSAQASLLSQFSGMVPVLGHSSSEVVPTPCTYQLLNKVGTMRRRIRGF